MDLILECTTRGNTTIVTVGGEIDIATGPAFKGYLIDLIDQGARDLLLDLDLVSFFDSTGLAVLVAALKRLGVHGGTLRLVCRQERILGTLADHAAGHRLSGICIDLQRGCRLP